MEKAVSVIIPVFNREDTIRRCIESVCNQTLEDIEIIVVNDGSDDNTLSVINAIDDERITVISQDNAGQGYARNVGIEIANGKYIAFVDSDDTIDREMLRVMYERAEMDSADIVQCNITDIYPDGEKSIQIKSRDETIIVEDKGYYTDKYFTPCHHSYEVCNKLINREFLMNSGVRFRDTKRFFSEDLMFNLEMIAHLNKISFIPEPYYNYYQNETSHLHSHAKRRLESLCELFRTYISEADENMKSAAEYTAAMIITYNAGLCAKSHREDALRILCGEELRGYIKTAFRRNCKTKHRLFLTALYIAPGTMKLLLAEKYSGRWNR
ncbi:MAG: glycosyltransferase family 2 protein [Oscillospiraceae bacterium]|nr:glycosyltransferase family 2 protein [Oscillospiraceae bacterium]